MGRMLVKELAFFLFLFCFLCFQTMRSTYMAVRDSQSHLDTLVSSTLVHDFEGSTSVIRHHPCTENGKRAKITID